MYKHHIPNSLSVGPSEEFIETPSVKNIIDRAMSYLEVGIPVHLTGPTGTGKSTLAMHLAYKLYQPIMLMFGDEEFATSDLVGDTTGYRKSKLVDNFIHSVLKTEENVSQRWVDNRLTTACKEGLTLIYDEFNRSRPEANNALLSVLEEGILTLPPSQEESGYIKVHPNFKAIFTSNPYEYAGVHKTQDALMDRMVSIHLDYFDEETERAIVVARTGIEQEDARRIVGILRDFRHLVSHYQAISIRPAIIIGKILKQKELHAQEHNPYFVDTCLDALISGRHNSEDREKLREVVVCLIHKHCQDDDEENELLSGSVDRRILEKLEAIIEATLPNGDRSRQKENYLGETHFRQFRPAVH
ncbi:MAG TPA: gas vesicle protein GvpN [Ktedonobacteraceae bacterium]|nr:gas vesicle protein GvpN [Ktedonobacteraceae bacterium]